MAHFESLVAKTRAEGNQKISDLRQELDHLRTMLYHSMQGGFPPLQSYPTPPAESTAQPLQGITPSPPFSSPISQQSAFIQSQRHIFPLFFSAANMPLQSKKTIFPCHRLRNTISWANASIVSFLILASLRRAVPPLRPLHLRKLPHPNLCRRLPVPLPPLRRRSAISAGEGVTARHPRVGTAIKAATLRDQEFGSHLASALITMISAPLASRYVPCHIFLMVRC